MFANLRESIPVLPDAVARATESARERGFPVEKDPTRDSCCIPPMGYLLMMATATKPGGRISEAGTAHGVGTAWIAAGLTGGATLTSAERHHEKSQLVSEIFAGRDDVSVLNGDSGDVLPPRGPYDMVFADGIGRTADLAGETGRILVAMLNVGGLLFFDDVRPAGWSEPDKSGTLKREYIASTKELVGTEIALTEEWSALMATRISP